MKIKKLLGVLVVCLLMTMMCCGCTKVYERTELETAYENGYITEEQLKSIAYYFNNKNVKDPPEPDFELIPQKRLSKFKENKIKRTYLKRPRVADDYRNNNIHYIWKYEYYGTYNGYAVAFVMDNLNTYRLKTEPVKTIGGVTFNNYYSLYAYYIG